jgi:hypothetical protein
MSQPEMCPICTKSFEEGDMTAGYRVWPSVLPRTAHFRCLMTCSATDELPWQKSKGTARSNG